MPRIYNKRGNKASLPALAKGELAVALDSGEIFAGADSGNVQAQRGVINGTCATAAGTAAKVVTISGYTPAAGHILAIAYTNGNTANSPTININGAGAKAVMIGGDELTGTSLTGPANVTAGGAVLYYYNGTNFIQLGRADSGQYPSMTTAAISKTVELANLQAEINALPKILKHSVTITVNEGEITSAISVSGFVSAGGYLYIYGANAVSAYTHKIASLTAQYCAGYIQIRGFTATAKSGNAFSSAYNSGYVYFNMCNATAGDKATSSFYGIRNVNGGALAYCANCDLQNKYSAYYCALAKMAVYNPIGVSNRRGFTADDGEITVRNTNTLEADTMYYQVNGGSIVLPSGLTWVTYYASCSTAAAVAAKTAAISNFTLLTGAQALIKFTLTNTAASPTLNINGTGAKPVFYNGYPVPPGYIAANKTYEFVYDGANYVIAGGDADTALAGSYAVTCDIGNLQAEINKLPKKLNFSVTITVNEGTYTGAITIKDFYGNGSIIVNGAAAAKTYTHKVAKVIIQNNALSSIQVRGFTATNLSGACFDSNRTGGYIYFHLDNVLGDAASAATSTFYGVAAVETSGFTYAYGCDLSNCYNAHNASSGGQLIVAGSTGSGNNVVYSAVYSGQINIRADGGCGGTTRLSKGSAGIIFDVGSEFYGSSASCAGNAATATALKTARSLKTKLNSTAAVTFDGSAAQDAIPVTGILPVANGGTGSASGLAWGNVTGKPTTLAGYGISDLPTETGSFTPTLQGTTAAGVITCSKNQGNYTRIGKYCYISVEISINSITTQPAGYMGITGLPFACNSNHASLMHGAFLLGSGAISESTYGTGTVVAGSSVLMLYANIGTITTVGVQGTNIKAGCSITIGGIYVIN